MDEEKSESFFGKVFLYFIAFMLAVVFVLNCISVDAQAAKYYTDERVVGDLAVISDTDIQWQYSGTDLLGSPPFNVANRGQYFTGSVADAFVSGKGDAGYSRVATLDANGAHTYDSSTLLAFTDGGVYSDGLYMGEYSINQSLTMCEEAQMNVRPQGFVGGTAAFPRTQHIQSSIIGAGQKGQYSSGKEIVQGAESPSTFEFNPEATGSGGAAILDTRINVKNGLDVNSTALNYEMDLHEHKGAGATENGTYELIKPMKFDSFEDLFGITPENSTYIENLTEVNETGNLTVNETETAE